MDPIEWMMELRTRQAAKLLNKEAQEFVDQIEDGIIGHAEDCAREIARYLSPAE